MIRNVVKQFEDRAVGVDDQQLAHVERSISKHESDRLKINARLRKLRRIKQVILERRVLTDSVV